MPASISCNPLGFLILEIASFYTQSSVDNKCTCPSLDQNYKINAHPLWHFTQKDLKKGMSVILWVYLHIIQAACTGFNWTGFDFELACTQSKA